MQFPKELRPWRSWWQCRKPSCLNEVQFPKELRLQVNDACLQLGVASMKCSSRRNCDTLMLSHSPR